MALIAFWQQPKREHPSCQSATYKENMKATKRIALVAHDERKEDLLAWTRLNVATLTRHQFNTIYDQEFKDYSAYIRRPI